ncbi:hypothetical protein LAZ67_6004027 [Cordylochernes scorpioides]|uniref:Uncharacterized protein n=1 Tax=Cordylochernes scorpioides TaxID=51811 RepID=A0ABY6KN01_9ARAC|nr:hypothetical protein LAZ67_6004027 [Cordylochernes scorpioides]
MCANDPFALSLRFHTIQRRLRQQEAAEAPKKIEGVLEIHLSNEVIREVYIDEIGLPDPRPPPAPPAGELTFAELNLRRWEEAGLSPPTSEVEVYDLWAHMIAETATTPETRRLKVWEIVEAVGISKERKWNTLHEELKIRKLCPRWVPHLLNADRKQKHKQHCRVG